MKTKFLFISAAVLSLGLSARTVVSLDGDWNYIVDPQNIGIKSYHCDPDTDTDNMNFGRNARVKNKFQLLEYDFNAADTLKVPGDWNTQKKELLWYEGTLWYARQFEFKKPLNGERVFVKFGAVSLKADVYMNGKKIGRHVGGFTPFEFEVTDIVKDGLNNIVVRANNTREKSGIPTKGFDWWNYGGIIRSVELESRSLNYIASWRADLKKGGDDGVIDVSLKLDKAVADIPVKFSVPELGVGFSGKTSGDGTLAFTVKARELQRWSPESPKLYKVELSAGEDKLTEEIGFRTIETRGGKIFLNGEEIFLKGVCIHDEAPGGGRVTTREEVLENISRAKSLGCNFVRLAHYPHIEMMVKECEKAGLLVWSEIPLYWMIDWNNSATYASAESQLKEMIGRDVRRANVIIWSIANETVPSKKRNEFLKRLAQKARSLDSTRLISMAMEVTYLEDGTYTIKDELNTEVDIISFNEYFGWYVQPKDIPNALWRIPFDKPVIISEFGGGAVAGRHGGVKDRWSEEMQKDIYEKNVKMFGRIKNLSGTCPWILNDFRSPRRPLAGVQDGYNRKGLFAPDGSEKLAAGVMRKYYMREYYLREYFKTKRERPDR